MENWCPNGSIEAIVVVSKTVFHDDIFGQGHIAPIDGQRSTGLPVFSYFANQVIELFADDNL
jgi:hypothetical protein